MSNDLRVWVVDASSLIQIRRGGFSKARQAAILKKLSLLPREGQVVYPPQVHEELGYAAEPDRISPELDWSKKTRGHAEQTPSFAVVRIILAKTPNLIDATSVRDTADPYVIALALETQSIGGVSIVTEDRRDYDDGGGGIRKYSLATVAGFWQIPVVPLAGFILTFPELI